MHGHSNKCFKENKISFWRCLNMDLNMRFIRRNPYAYTDLNMIISLYIFNLLVHLC